MPTLQHRRADAVVTSSTPTAARSPTPTSSSPRSGTRSCSATSGSTSSRSPTRRARPPSRPLRRSARPDRAALADLWFDVFNSATLPFYWGRFEPVRGRPDTARLLDGGALVRGARRRRQGSPAGLAHGRRALAARPDDRRDRRTCRTPGSVARSPTSPGSIDTWDVINEVVIMPVFDKEPNGLTRLAWDRGRIPTIRLAFDAARQTNPSATLLLNDFDMSTAYECLIEGVPRGGHPGRRDRPAEPHAPGLLGRGEDAAPSSTGSRASGCRCT